MIGKLSRTSDATSSSSRGPEAATPGKTTLVQQIAQRDAAAGGASEGQVHAAAEHGMAGAGQELPHLAHIQAAFGRHDVTGVRAHVGGAAAEGATAMGATAYARGGEVAFAGTPDLHTAAHEAAHVVQQSGGGVQLKGGVGEAGDGYERHADAVADRVVSGGSAEALLDQHATPGGAAGAGQVQRSLVQRRDQNGPYAGNRPDPSRTTDPTYVLRSNGNRVLHVGNGVEYRIEQTQATMEAANSHYSIRWQVINDPAAVQSSGVPATVDGPADQWRWGNLTAQVPGVHTIKAWVSLDGRQLGELTYQQQVVPNNTAPVQVPPGTAASSLVTMRDFIALVRRIETAYGGLPWQDVVSRMRKEDYPGPSSGLLAGSKASTGWDDLIDEQEGIPGLEVPPVAMADVAAIRRTQVVTTDSGQAVDIGHILTGVDSFNFPGVAGLFAAQGMEGPAAATWSGDVGSALVTWAATATGPDTDQARLDFYNRLANPSDMLGDVDGLAVAHGPNLNVPPTAPLSQRLEAFYQTAPTTGQSQRYHNFCRASHFTLAGNRLDAAAQARIRDQIARFSRGFQLQFPFAMVTNQPNIPLEQTFTGRIELNVAWFANHFIEWVNTGLASEGSP